MTAIKIQGPNSPSSGSSLILENENTIESRSEQSMSDTSSNSSCSGSSIESISNARSINITLKDKDRPLKYHATIESSVGIGHSPTYNTRSSFKIEKNKD
jgi:hypothetical protein